MPTEEEIKQLKSQNDLLQLQLEDLNYMIESREEELDILKRTASNTVQLQSRLEQNLHEMEQMQLQIGEQQQKLTGASRREASAETEIIQSIQIERDYYELRDQFNSTKTALADITIEMEETSLLHKKVKDLEAKLASVESNLEIADLDKQFLKEELDKYRKTESISTGG